jgi:hypothetical protein
MTENKVKIGSVENTEIEGVIDLNDPALYFNRAIVVDDLSSHDGE